MFDSDVDDKHAHGPVWRHGCRCGGAYIIRGAEMEAGHHLVGCSSCSEVVWVGYEVADDG